MDIELAQRHRLLNRLKSLQPRRSARELWEPEIPDFLVRARGHHQPRWRSMGTWY